MTDTQTLTISWTRADADYHRRVFRGVFGVVLVAETVLAIALVVWPSWIASLTSWSAQESSLWVRSAGVMWIVINLFQVPGWLNPLYKRWPNIIGLPWRFLLAVMCISLGGYAVALAIAEFVAAAALPVLYWRALRAELLCRP
jgi:hypothetical protein